MKLSLTLILLTTFSGLLSAATIPKGTGAAITQVQNTADPLRIYYQDNTSGSGIREISVKTPTSAPSSNGLIHGGATRANTPLAALSWGADPQVRVYFITPSNTLSEVAYIPGKGWNSGGNIGFPVLAGSETLYATFLNNVLIVGYTNDGGSLSEAYYDLNNPGWKTYVV
ncbi:hypothetical protein BU23DRAFT_564462 [Bimuria novae-zelandiae CBS 107.79]|uniref:Uncharacterized protein n=1 Tax=Bimuria novae-zelandiae CBS 107.79 TaxID=1447943 RepID=A0A6A5VYH3_9PLEO|nr:hypothetical protein BU23DRAFT_564462 [Bimuria novae-zelandiae CBS 107.79]